MRYRNIWVNATVVGIEDVASNVRQIQLVPESGVAKYTVGAHLDVSVLINNQPEVRSYSLVGGYTPHTPYTLAVKRLPQSKGGSEYMWKLNVGSKIKVSQPTNHFELNFGAKSYLLIAGGIGITPLYGMAQQLAHRSDMEVKMLYIGTSSEEMPYLKELQALLGSRLQLHFSDASGLYDTSGILELAAPHTQVYLCGPIGLMDAVRKTWEQGPYDPLHLRYETFGASGMFAPQAFTVRIPRFNKEIVVGEHETLLHALAAAHIEVMHDCNKGECGLCQVTVLEYSGDIDHRDFFFSADEKGENKKICACVSRVANGSLTIDTAYRGAKYSDAPK